MDDIIEAIEAELEYIHDILEDCTLPTKNYYEGKQVAYLTVLNLLIEERSNNMDG